MAPAPEILADGIRLSAAQVTRFTGCEMRWLLTKTTPREDPGGPEPEYFLLGRLVHACRQAHGQGGDWRILLDLEARNTPGWTPDFEYPGYVQKALRIMEDYELLNGPPAPKLMAVEMPFDLLVPGTKDVRVRGFLDGIVRVPDPAGIGVHDTYRIEEYKTMARWGRERRVPYAMDTWIYLWAGKQLLPNLTGLDFRAISTYDYKPEEPSNPDNPATIETARRHDAEKRFRTVSVEYDQQFVDRVLDDLRRISKRGKELLLHPERAVRNITDDCGRCEFKQACLMPWDPWQEVR